MIGALIGAMAGYKFGEKYLSNVKEFPAWTGQCGEALMTITALRYHGKIIYKLYITTHGNSVEVSSSEHYPVVIGAVQTWERFLKGGGTVEGWLANNAERAKEVAALDKSL